MLYDEHIKLVLSAETPPEELFTEGENAADFQRTVSRLHEMQSAEYRLLPRRAPRDRADGALARGPPAWRCLLPSRWRSIPTPSTGGSTCRCGSSSP